MARRGGARAVFALCRSVGAVAVTGRKLLRRRLHRRHRWSAATSRRAKLDNANHVRRRPAGLGPDRRLHAPRRPARGLPARAPTCPARTCSRPTCARARSPPPTRKERLSDAGARPPRRRGPGRQSWSAPTCNARACPGVMRHQGRLHRRDDEGLQAGPRQPEAGSTASGPTWPGPTFRARTCAGADLTRRRSWSGPRPSPGTSPTPTWTGALTDQAVGQGRRPTCPTTQMIARPRPVVRDRRRRGHALDLRQRRPARAEIHPRLQPDRPVGQGARCSTASTWRACSMQGAQLGGGGPARLQPARGRPARRAPDRRQAQRRRTCARPIWVRC